MKTQFIKHDSSHQRVYEIQDLLPKLSFALQIFDKMLNEGKEPVRIYQELQHQKNELVAERDKLKAEGNIE